jgi:hypothetical protein
MCFHYFIGFDTKENTYRSPSRSYLCHDHHCAHCANTLELGDGEQGSIVPYNFFSHLGNKLGGITPSPTRLLHPWMVYRHAYHLSKHANELVFAFALSDINKPRLLLLAPDLSERLLRTSLSFLPMARDNSKSSETAQAIFKKLKAGKKVCFSIYYLYA